MSAACLYPVSPSSLPRMKPVQTVKVTPLYPPSTALEPVGNNGHVPTLEQKKESNSTKAVAPAKKKAAPARRTKKQAGK